jgi:hypothetical protein
MDPISQPRIDLREPGAAGAFEALGQQLAGQLAIPTPAHAAPIAESTAPKRSWLTLGAHLLRNAAIAVALMTLIPVSLVMLQGDRFARGLYEANVNTSARVAAADAVRPFALPADPSITPIQAGRALNGLQPIARSTSGFVVIEPASRPEASWRNATIAPDMFPTARPDFFSTTPASRSVLEAAVEGFTPREREYLRTLATAPVWHDFDLVARAPAVDVIGGQLRTPFGQELFAEQRPVATFKNSRELVSAAVSRAAWHLTMGRRDSAEAVLRTIVSYGFTIIDNSTTKFDELIGTVIVGVGRDALQRFYAIEHDPRATLSALAPPARRAVSDGARQAGALLSPDDARRGLLARVEDPAVPRGDRFDGLRSLSVSSCTNVRELLFGPRADVVDALARARQTLARYPSERALIDLETRTPSPAPGLTQGNPFQELAVSAASVAGAVLQNPRLASCTLVLTSRSYPSR